MSDSTTDSESVTRPADTMRERVGESRLKIWFLITANRWIVTGVFLLLAYVTLLVLHVFGPSSVRKIVTTSAVSSLFGSVIIALITSITLVLSISQFVLTEEIGPLGEQRDKMRNETKFRNDVEETAGIEVAPAEPSRFLRTLIETADTYARELRDTVSEEADDEEGLAEIESYADGLLEHSQEVTSELENVDFGSFDVLLPVLNYNYSWKIFAARNLREKYADSLSDEADEIFDELIESLRFFGPAREHFKTLYVQWEIINISRGVLYGAMPALAIAAYMILSFDAARLFGSAVFGIDTAFLFVSAMYVLTLTPFAVVLAYVVRVLTVIKRTLAIGPFVLRETEQLYSARYEELSEIEGGEE
ncbi:hypothetical protein [Halococcus agarilyticus]|uniref:hypothetical protein n=1 Tax=Halococcus agarilyticus TaxID=1232219 RepID=UPI000677D158|nr:hypothetical protein [Halococcus agarilyticus]